MVDEIKKELDELKVEAYDMENAFAKYKQEMSQKISELSDKISQLKENDKVEENVVTESTPVIEPEIQKDALESIPVSETTPVIAPVIENPDVNVVPSIQSDVTEPVVSGTAPVVENITEPAVVNLPLIQPEVEEVKEEIPGPQVLDQTPLSPVGVEVQPVQDSSGDKKVFIKTDSNSPKAILFSEEQSKKSRSSKDVQANLVFKTDEVKVETSNPVVEVPVAEQTGSSESIESIEKQMADMMNELATTTDEVKANEINKNLAALNEKRMLLTKSVA